MMIKINLPFPHKNLFPNKIRSNHWSVSNRQIASARADAHKSAIAVNGHRFKADKIKARVIITPPDKRRRDKANMEGACKAYIDGVADCIKVDDFHWGAIEWVHCNSKAPGSVVFEIEAVDQ